MHEVIVPTENIPEILIIPNPVLLQRAKRVEISEGTERLVERMHKILLASETGVGLAAPQIGESSQIFLMRLKITFPIETFINPRLTWKSSEKIHLPIKEAREGCLSIPNVVKILDRHRSVRIVYQAISGETKEERFDGWAARIIQHEYDHLNGILITSKSR